MTFRVVALPHKVGPLLALTALFAAGFVSSGSFLVGCGEDTAAEPGEEAGALDASRRDAARADGGGGEEEDAGEDLPLDVAACKALRKHYEECGLEPQCPMATFDEWCLENTRSVDSDAYRRASITCATSANCSGDARKDCMYKSYAGETPTAAQEQLATGYCQMCQPEDVAGCVTRTKKYSPAAGPGSVTSEFIQVWELSDAVVEKIRANCTGAGGGAWDGGADPIACATKFDRCAGDYYIEALADCP